MPEDSEFITFSKNPRFAKMPKKTNFLVLDDMDSMQVAVSRDLKRIGFTGNFYGVKTIAEAKEALETHDIHFIFADWNLQDGEIGLDFLKHVRKHHKQPLFPVVMFTTESEVENILEAVEAGASNYLVKPWEIEELREKVSHAYNGFING